MSFYEARRRLLDEEGIEEGVCERAAAPPVVVPVDAVPPKAENYERDEWSIRRREDDAINATITHLANANREIELLRSRLTAVERALAIQAEISVKLSAHATAVEQERDDARSVIRQLIRPDNGRCNQCHGYWGYRPDGSWRYDDGRHTSSCIGFAAARSSSDQEGR